MYIYIYIERDVHTARHDRGGEKARAAEGVRRCEYEAASEAIQFLTDYVAPIYIYIYTYILHVYIYIYIYIYNTYIYIYIHPVLPVPMAQQDEDPEVQVNRHETVQVRRCEYEAASELNTGWSSHTGILQSPQTSTKDAQKNVKVPARGTPRLGRRIAALDYVANRNETVHILAIFYPPLK